MSTMSLALSPREDPGRHASAALAAVVHLALAAFLVYGIRWQTSPPVAVEVELYRAAPAQPAYVPPPEAKPQPKIEPKPEPKAEPKPLKPDIALKQKEVLKPQPKAEPKPEPKQKPEPKPKPKPKTEPKPKLDPFKDQIARELAQVEQRKAVEADAQILAKVKADQAADARARATADYIGKIRRKIKGNIVLPPEIKGNPEAIFDVVQLPSGEVLNVKLKKSSGHKGYDAAVERAILKSSPLPKPDKGDLFSRTLELRFRPLEE